MFPLYFTLCYDLSFDWKQCLTMCVSRFSYLSRFKFQMLQFLVFDVKYYLNHLLLKRNINVDLSFFCFLFFFVKVLKIHESTSYCYERWCTLLCLHKLLQVTSLSNIIEGKKIQSVKRSYVFVWFHFLMSWLFWNRFFFICCSYY